jgi:hypothetical protein
MVQRVMFGFCLLGASWAASAQDFYFGASGGLTEAKDFQTSIFGMYTPDAELDTEDFGFRGFLGAGFTRYFGIEIGYDDLGEASYSGTTPGNPPPYGYPAGPAGGSVAVSGYDITITGRWPITKKVTMGPRVGLFRWTLESALVDANGQHRFSDETGSDWLLGLDIVSQLGSSVDLTLGYTNYAVDCQRQIPRRYITNYDTRVLSLGLAYRFGS